MQAATSQPQPKKLKKVSLLLDWLVQGHQAQFYLAKKEGLFARQGLDVTIIPGKGSGGTVAQVAQGHYDFGFADGAVTMQYRSKGSPVEMVFGINRKTPSAIIYAKGLGIRTPKDLAGRSIAFTPGGAAASLAPTFLKNAGVPLSRVRLVSASAAARDSLLLTHKVAAIASLFTTEHAPLLAKGLKTGWFSYADYGLNLPGAGIVVSDSMLRQHPGTIRAFLTAVAQGMKDAEANPAAAIAAEQQLSQAPGFDPKSNLIVLKDSITTWSTPETAGHPLGWMPPQDWANAAKILEADMKMKPVDPTGVYTNTLVPS